jgi:hypothetical protein
MRQGPMSAGQPNRMDFVNHDMPLLGSQKIKESIMKCSAVLLMGGVDG